MHRLNLRLNIAIGSINSGHGEVATRASCRKRRAPQGWELDSCSTRRLGEEKGSLNADVWIPSPNRCFIFIFRCQAGTTRNKWECYQTSYKRKKTDGSNDISSSASTYAMAHLYWSTSHSRAYIEAIEEYEKKLVSLEKDLRSSLQKEAERRFEYDSKP